MAGEKIGEVIHFFPKISVAVVKFDKEASIGDEIVIRGTRGEKHEEFEAPQKIESMQKDHEVQETAKVGDELGMKVSGEVKEGDTVHKA